MKPYTPETLAAEWQCSPKHIRNLINKGELNAFRLGGKLLRIPVEAAEAVRPGTYRPPAPPIQPRGLSRDDAATHLGIPVERFDILLRRGQIDCPRNIDGVKVWDRATLKIGDQFEYAAETIAGVYVVRFSNFLKIGISQNIYRRIVGLEEHLPEYLTIVAMLQGGDRRLEEKLHRRFSTERRKGEWFEIGPMLTAWIADGCPP